MEQRGRRRIWLSVLMALAAMLVYAGVTYFVNRPHPGALRAAWVQGAVCLLATFTSSYLMQLLFEVGRSPVGRFLWASVGAGAVMFGLMALVHRINGTPALLATLASSALLATPYYVLFPLFLLKRFDGSDAGIRWIASPYSPGVLARVVVHHVVGPSRRNRSLSSMCPQDLTLHAVQPVLRLGFVGDLMPLRGRPFGLDPEILDFFAGIDYLVCNFEGSLFPGGKRALLAQVHETDVLDLVTQVLPPERIVLSGANNHAADFGLEAFRKTAAHLRERGFRVIGSRDEPSCMLQDAVQIVAATEWTNQDAEYLSELHEAVDAADEGAAFRVLYPHWGHELQLYPSQAQIDRAQQLLRPFDLIVGAHPHTPGVVSTGSADGREKMVAYSLGDFTVGFGLGSGKYAWGQVLRVELGPPLDAPGTRAWRQGRTRWQFSHVVSAGGRARVLRLEDRCPWFEPAGVR